MHRAEPPGSEHKVTITEVCEQVNYGFSFCVPQAVDRRIYSDETLQSAVELVIVGDPDSPAIEALRRAVHGKSLLTKIVRRLPADAQLASDHLTGASQRRASFLHLLRHGSAGASD